MDGTVRGPKMILEAIEKTLLKLNENIKDENEKITADLKKHTLYNMYWALYTIDNATTLLILKGMLVSQAIALNQAKENKRLIKENEEELI